MPPQENAKVEKVCPSRLAVLSRHSHMTLLLWHIPSQIRNVMDLWNMRPYFLFIRNSLLIFGLSWGLFQYFLSGNESLREREWDSVTQLKFIDMSEVYQLFNQPADGESNLVFVSVLVVWTVNIEDRFVCRLICVFSQCMRRTLSNDEND